MLPLLQKQFRLSKRASFLGKLLLISFGVHIIVLLSGMIVFGKKTKLIIPLHLQDAAVVIMPFTKTVGIVNAAVATKSGPLKKSQTSFIEVAAKKKDAPQKAVVKKAVPIKKDPPKKPAVAKKEKKPVEKKIPAPKGIPKNAVVSKKAKAHASAQQVVQQKGATETIAIGRDDAFLLSLIKELKTAIEQEWHRPAGLTVDSTYHVELYIDSRGSVSIKNEHSSGALALDITARSFVLSYSYPKRVWGREIELIL